MPRIWLAVSDGDLLRQALADDAPELGGHVMDGLLVQPGRRGGAGEQQQRGEHPARTALTTALEKSVQSPAGKLVGQRAPVLETHAACDR